MKIRITGLLLLLLVISCEPDNSAPIAQFICAPPNGNVKTLFDLDATSTTDPDGLKYLLLYRWDYNGDGQWDTPFGPYQISSCQFLNPGTYNIRLEVKDTYGGVTSSMVSVLVDSLHHITDPRDGQKYPIIKIGSFWWMGRNLNIGKPVDTAVEQSNNGVIEKYSYPASDSLNLNGGLYTWAEMMGYGYAEKSQGICPPGWHIPSDAEWNNLMSVFRTQAAHFTPTYQIWGEKFIPDQQVTHNNYLTEGAVWKLLRETGSTGFDAVTLGYRNPDGLFADRDYHFPGNTATWWSSTMSGDYAIRVRLYKLDTRQGDVIRFADNRRFAFSVRCVKISI